MIYLRNGQIWIETVLYTLIGIALIGLVLAIATPAINGARDRIVVEQTIETLNDWDSKINELLGTVSGNSRTISALTMRKGELYVNPSNDSIVIMVKDLHSPYSELGIPIEIGKIQLISLQDGNSDFVRLTLDYKNLSDLTYAGGDELKKFVASPTPYSFLIRNMGGANITQIDIEETSRR